MTIFNNTFYENKALDYSDIYFAAKNSHVEFKYVNFINSRTT